MQANMASDKLTVKPPIETNAIKNFDPAVIKQDAAETEIIVHPRFPELVERFLEHKRVHGSKYEKALYITPTDFRWQDEVTRLIEKRPLTFVGEKDYTMLRDGTIPSVDMAEEWDRNGTDMQHMNKYLTLQDYLSYDEIMLGSLIGVSGPSYFINDGNRLNQGRPGVPGTFESRGIIIGLVGARFERPDRMDSVHILTTAKNPHQDPRLSKIFHNFFQADKYPGVTFDKVMYQARIRVAADVLLLEADSRAKKAGKTAYTYVVGLGLGVWGVRREQPVCYIDTFTSAIEALTLSNVSTIEFAWIDVPARVEDTITRVAAKQGIKIIFGRRNPAEKLNTNELLVLSYAWDGNAFPGNEYWEGSLYASGDPAAACMSTIGELHNPLVNPFSSRIRVLRH